MSGFRNQWTQPKAPPGFRRFWGTKPSDAAAVACTVTASGSYVCAAPGSSPPTYAACDFNNQTATNLGRFGFFIERDDNQQFIGWNTCDGNAGQIIPQSSDFSISLWMTMDAANWRNRTHIWSGVNGTTDCFAGSGNNYILFGRWSGKVTFEFVDDTDADFYIQGSTTGFTSYDRWYHIGVTYNSTTGLTTLYRDGAVDGSTKTHSGGGGFNTQKKATESAISVPDPQHIGSNRSVGGNVDDIGVWNSVLSAANMASLYNSGDGAKCDTVESANLVHYIDFEIGPGNEPKDTIAGGMGAGVWHKGGSDPVASPDTFGTGSATPGGCTY